MNKEQLYQSFWQLVYDIFLSNKWVFIQYENGFNEIFVQCSFIKFRVVTQKIIRLTRNSRKWISYC